MNKNTIVKLIAVLAMCFLIGGALVACKGAAGPAGPQGPQGEKGETGAAGSTPVLTIGANGNWFADGVDLGVKAPSADAACAEHDFAFIDVVKHTQTEDGVVVKACKSCGYAAITNETLHVMEAGEIPANCLEAKWVGEFCSVCNFKGEGEFVGAANGHNWSKAQPVFESGKPTCQYGGLVAQHCLDCAETTTKSVTAEEYPCNVLNWDYEGAIAPTEETVGVLEGTCSICKGTDSYELPVLGSDAYDVTEVKAATCGAAGEYKYNLVDADRNVVYTYTVKPAATGHKLNGQNFANYDIDEDPNTGITVPYWYGTADASGRLAPLGVLPFSGQKFVCEAEANGYFKCEECNDIVAVNVYYAHNGVSKTITPATCSTEGAREVDCDNCPEDSYNKKEDGSYANATGPVAIPKLPHTYNYQLVKDTTKSVTVDGQTLDVYILTGACTGNGCDTCTGGDVVATSTTTSSPAVATYSNEDGEPYYLVNVVDTVEVEPTCTNIGKTKYTFYYVVDFDDPATTDVDEQVISGVTKSYTVNIAKTNHKLGGKFLTDEEIVALKSNTSGIKNAANKAEEWKNAQCESLLDGYFYCEHCEDVVAVQVTKAHAEVNQRDFVAATCNAPGSYVYDCNNDNCTDSDGLALNGVLPQLEHNKVQNIVEYGDHYAIVETCANENCTYNVLILEVEEYKLGAKYDSTCYYAGYQIYRVKVNGEVKEFKLPLPIKSHTVAGLLIDSDEFIEKYTDAGRYLYGTAGVGVFGNQGNELVCGSTANGYFKCEVCEAAGLDALVDGITVYKPHVVATELVPATCTTGASNKCTCGAVWTGKIPGHKYEYTVEVNTSTDVATIKGACFCTATFEATFDLEAPADFDEKDEFYKVSLVSAATCVTGAKYHFVGSLKHVDDLAGNHTFTQIKLDDDKTTANVTVEFDLYGDPNGHDYEKAQLVIFENDEKVDADSEETEKYYYFVLVCNECGNYANVDKMDAEEYAEYLEMTKIQKDAKMAAWVTVAKNA